MTASQRTLWLSVLGVLLVTSALLAIGLGPVSTPPADTAAALMRLLTGQPAADGDLLITNIRLPRVLTSILVGGALAVAGAAMQAVFRNPLAEPGITGVSSGAAAAAVLVIVAPPALLGTSGAASLLSARTSWLLPAAAFAGALAATALVQTVGYRGRGRSTATLLLVGMSLNAFLGAVIAAAIANASNPEDARSAMFWLNGDLTGRTMGDVALAVIPLLIGVAGVLLFARELNMLTLGEATAQASGVNVRRISQLVLTSAALATAAGVAITGVISFVGLVVPHLIRLMFRGGHGFLLPASFLLGGIFLTAADTAARLIFNPVVLQTGTITALIGAPFLLFLVLKGRNRA